MRVALLTNFIPPYRIPFFRAVAQRVEQLRVLVSTPMEKGRPWNADSADLDVALQRTLTLPSKWKSEGFTEHGELHFPLDTARQLERFGPDVIVTGEMGARSLAALRFGRRTGTPVALWATLSDQTERDRGAVRRWLRTWILERVALIVVNGEAGARYIRGFGIAEARLVRMPYTTGLEPFLAVSHSESGGAALQVLFVGNLTERKAPDRLIAGAQKAAAAAQPIALTVVGDGPLRTRLEGMVASATPGLTVTLAGAVDYASLPLFYAKADLLAYPTLADEWGLVVNEALAAGVPVLGTRYSQAVEELIDDGTNGWVLDGADVDTIARGLERARGVERTTLQRMRAAARSTALSLAPETAADTFVAALRGLIP